MSEEEFEYSSLDELADAMEQGVEGPPAVEVWQDYDPSMRFIMVYPVTEDQGAVNSTVAYYIIEPGKHSGLHGDNAEEVIYCADGSGEVFVSGKQVKLEPGCRSDRDRRVARRRLAFRVRRPEPGRAGAEPARGS